jgi:hypothetical protein
MPGLDPGIHVFAGHEARKVVDGRVKPGYDELSVHTPKYRCCRSGSSISACEVPLHTARPRSMM